MEDNRHLWGTLTCKTSDGEEHEREVPVDRVVRALVLSLPCGCTVVPIPGQSAWNVCTDMESSAPRTL